MSVNKVGGVQRGLGNGDRGGGGSGSGDENSSSGSSNSRASDAIAAIQNNSHNINSNTVANISHVHNEHNKRNFQNYQSRQRMHRSSQNDRRAHRSQTVTKTSSNDANETDDANDSQQEIRIGIRAPLASDEARYNLATRIMSNGVEVIVAGDKSTLPGHPNQHLRILTSSGDPFKTPLTLAPSTLKDHMLLMLPHQTSTNAHNKNNGNAGSGSNDKNHVVVDGGAMLVSNRKWFREYRFRVPLPVGSIEMIVAK